MRLRTWTATSTSVARRWSVCAQPVADYLLELADGRLGASPLRVAGGSLPSRVAVLGDELKTAVALHGAVWAVPLGTAVRRGGTIKPPTIWQNAGVTRSAWVGWRRCWVDAEHDVDVIGADLDPFD